MSRLPRINQMMHDHTLADQQKPMPAMRTSPMTTIQFDQVNWADFINDGLQYTDEADVPILRRTNDYVEMDVNVVFKLLKEDGYDRPSAFNSFCCWAKVPNEEVRELDMRAGGLHFMPDNDAMVANEREYLSRIFGGAIPSELMDRDWDT